MAAEIHDDEPLERFHHAWFAPELELLGFRCRPFCLGHLLTLQAIGSPFARLGQPEVSGNLSDLILALRVCESRWPFRGLDGIEAEPSEREAAIIESAIADRAVFDSAFDDFVSWIALCSRGPELIETKSDETRPLTAPLVLGLAVRVVRSGWSERRVWTMPISLVRHFAAAIGEQEGGAEFLSAEMLAAIRHADAQPIYTEVQIREHALRDLGPKRAASWFHVRDEWLAANKPEEAAAWAALRDEWLAAHQIPNHGGPN